MKRTLFFLLLLPFFGIAQSFSGTYYVGVSHPAPFNKLTSAISALHSEGISGPVTLLLDDVVYSNATGETFPLTINAIAGSSATNTITIRPANGVNTVIKASNVNGWTGVPAVFKINGGDNVIIDGSNIPGATTKNLTIENSDNINSTARSIVWVASVGASNPATNFTLKNANLKQAYANGDYQYNIGVYSGNNNLGSNNSLGMAASVSNNMGIRIINNTFINVKQGVYLNAGSPVTTDAVISQNTFGGETNNETLVLPVYLSNVERFSITENVIQHLYRTNASGSLLSAGIMISGNSKNGYIQKNNLRDLVNTSNQSGFSGIRLASSSNNSNIEVSNNFVLNVVAGGSGDALSNGHGITLLSGGNYKLYNNTVVLERNQPGGGYSAALYVNAGLSNLDVRNNIFANFQTNQNTRRVAILIKQNNGNINSVFSHLNYNNYFSYDKIGFNGSNSNWSDSPDYRATFSEWQAATGKDAQSLNIEPQFVSPTDLHLTGDNAALNNVGTPIAGLTTDIDGQLRNSSAPDMGADEFGTLNNGITGPSNQGIYCEASTTWDGTSWSNGEPTADKDAIFNGNFTQNGGTLTACSMVVEGTAQVVFTGNSNAVITHNVNVEETANVTFESGSNLIQIENTQNVGSITVKRFGSRLKRLDYTFWSSPVTGTQTLLQFSPATQTSRFYTYSTLTNSYISEASPSTATFTTARGYLIRMPNTITGPQAQAYAVGGYRFAFEGVFTGVPNNGNIYIPLNYGGPNNCYNSVGNPYPSPISVTDFIDANINNIEGTIWVWRKDNNPAATSYGTITKMGYTANSAPGGSANSNGAAGNNDLIADPFSIDAEGVLNTGQGFMVKAKTGQDLVFRNNMRKSDNYNNFFRSAETAGTEQQSNALEASRLWLNATNSAADVFSQTLIGYTSQATLGYDNGIDGKGFVDGTVALYTLVEDMRLAIQGRPAFTNTDVVPLGFKTEAAGEYIIALDRVNGLFSGDQEIYLKDNVTGVVHNIKEESYTFTSEVGTYEDRFEVVYIKETSELGTGSDEIAASDVMVYRNGQQVKIQSPEEIRAVTVYDVNGKMLYQKSTVNDTEFISPALTATQQMLIIHVECANGQVVSKKIIMN